MWCEILGLAPRFSIGTVPEYSSGNDWQPDPGLVAVQAGQNVHPDVALLDIGLPKQTDMQQSWLIRQEEWVKRAVLVALPVW